MGVGVSSSAYSERGGWRAAKATGADKGVDIAGEICCVEFFAGRVVLYVPRIGSQSSNPLCRPRGSPPPPYGIGEWTLGWSTVVGRQMRGAHYYLVRL